MRVLPELSGGPPASRAGPAATEGLEQAHRRRQAGLLAVLHPGDGGVVGRTTAVR